MIEPVQTGTVDQIRAHVTEGRHALQTVQARLAELQRELDDLSERHEALEAKQVGLLRLDSPIRKWSSTAGLLGCWVR